MGGCLVTGPNVALNSVRNENPADRPPCDWLASAATAGFCALAAGTPCSGYRARASYVRDPSTSAFRAHDTHDLRFAKP